MSKRIYIGLSVPKKENIFSRIIKFVLKTNYSHTYVRWETKWGFDSVYEASGTSVKFVGGDIWHSKNKVLKEWPLDLDDDKYYSKFLPYILSISGLNYDFFQILGILFYLYCPKIKPKKDKSKMVCSEVIYYILTEIFDKKWDIDPDVVTPKNIEKYLDKTATNQGNGL